MTTKIGLLAIDLGSDGVFGLCPASCLGRYEVLRFELMVVGRGTAILAEREKIKKLTIQSRFISHVEMSLNHRTTARGIPFVNTT
ncbi:hypothetical protein [Paracoccus sp. J39]|uniref:hypothetical protein n=1 Tax=Paracoccus sp. J39 TaxID=935848 RepID=UPI00048A7F5B|nr:hypothetical protein [Paracoccus sp. J39]